MWGIVPVKRFDSAKERLSGVMSPARRAMLARWMADKVLSELAQVRTLDGVLVVSNEEGLGAEIQRHGFRLMADQGNCLNAALTAAIHTLTEENVHDTVIVHADLPLFEAPEFDRVAATHARGATRKISIVPDAAGVGTNLRFCRPPDAVSPLFGDGSLQRHVQAAHACKVAVELIRSPSLSLDCDTAADIDRILQHADASLREELLALVGALHAGATPFERVPL